MNDTTEELQELVSCPGCDGSGIITGVKGSAPHGDKNPHPDDIVYRKYSYECPHCKGVGKVNKLTASVVQYQKIELELIRGMT